MLEFYFRKVEGVWFGVVVEGQSVVATTFASDESKALQNMQEILGFCVPLQVAGASSTLAEKTLTVMETVYGGKNLDGNVPLAMESLPAYTQHVLRTVSQIPVGYVASYGAVAEVVGGGARAVGNVMANNPFAPIVPCHRVVTSSLGLGGYGGGLKVKVDFLEREKRGFTDKIEVLVEGGVFRVFPVEFVLRKLGNNCLRSLLQHDRQK
jgi:O-6-methylguanine DNA methyltransferase